MKLNPASPLARLMDNFPQAGTLARIGLRAAPRAPLQAVTHVEALAGHGLVGDAVDFRATSPGAAD